MIGFIISAVKIIFLIGFLVFIHEGGHFLVAKLCKVKVNQFAIGFGPEIFSKQGKETKYVLRLIPFGGFVSMEGEGELSEEQGAFNKASIPQRIAIVAAGGLVNILFGLIIYWGLIIYLYKDIGAAFEATFTFGKALIESLKMLFTGGVGINDLTGPVGISSLISGTTGAVEYLYMLSMISVSLGITNLLPFPALDGGKIVIYIIEAIRKKPLKENTEIYIQLLGFGLLIALSIFVTYNDIVRLF